MNVDLFVRIPEDNAKFDVRFHQYLVVPDIEQELAQEVINALYPQNFGEGMAAQLETMRGNCYYGTERMMEYVASLLGTTKAAVVADIAGWVADRRLIAVEYRTDTLGVLVTGIYKVEAETVEAA